MTFLVPSKQAGEGEALAASLEDPLDVFVREGARPERKVVHVAGHLGGIAYADGRIYGAFIIRRREDMKDGKPGLLRVWDEELNQIDEKACEETAGAVGVLGDTIYYAIGHDKKPHRPCSVKRLGLDLADRGNQTFDFGYDIKYGIQAIATDGKSLICANYGGASFTDITE